ncbi:MAG: hypothetical protein KDI48_02150 [Xanthomonadales bacterium]|nr:hypothetical protein [Xanthomonadales bacterium]
MSRLTNLADRLLRWLLPRVAGKRKPDLTIGPLADPYLCRWYVLPRNRLFNVYLHQFWRSDDDRALHDHPWWSLSWCLRGTMVEHTIAPGGIHRRQRVRAGDVRLRTARAAHRLEVEHGAAPVYTLFITGPRLRAWGFHCPAAGWVPWQRFVAGTDDASRGLIGPGCGDEPVPDDPSNDWRKFSRKLTPWKERDHA